MSPLEVRHPDVASPLARPNIRADTARIATEPLACHRIRRRDHRSRSPIIRLAAKLHHLLKPEFMRPGCPLPRTHDTACSHLSACVVATRRRATKHLKRPMARPHLPQSGLHALLDHFARGELAIVEVGVEATLRQQLLVFAVLDNRSVVHHQNQVGATNRREPMGDDEAGAALH